jgi:hypothetical protein
MQRDSVLWDETTDEKHFYIVHNQHFKLATHVGCARDLEHQLAQRCKRPHAASSWQLVLFVIVPPLRNWRVDELRRHSIGKGLELRTQRTLQKAREMHLEWRLTVEALDPDSSLYMPTVVAALHACGLLERRLIRPYLIETPHLEQTLERLAGAWSSKRRRLVAT